jgi:hypothetical protein
MFDILFMFFVLIMLNLRPSTFRVSYLFSIIIQIDQIEKYVYGYYFLMHGLGTPYVIPSQLTLFLFAQVYFMHGPLLPL